MVTQNAPHWDLAIAKSLLVDRAWLAKLSTPIVSEELALLTSNDYSNGIIK